MHMTDIYISETDESKYSGAFTLVLAFFFLSGIHRRWAALENSNRAHNSYQTIAVLLLLSESAILSFRSI